VVQHNTVDKRLVKRSVAALRKAGASVLGVVLNAVPDVARGDYYYYSYRPVTEAAAPEAPRD
jgi:Mrp family chromosome partitioning ATPase